MIIFPSNVIPYFLASIATFVVGVRSWRNYQKLNSPLSRHFAISGFLASFGLFLYSAPFMLGVSGTALRVALLAGRFCLDLVGYYQLYLIWYLTDLRRFSIYWLVVPALIIGIPAYLLQANYILHAQLGVVNNLASTEYTSLALYGHAVALLIVMAAGLVLAKFAFAQSETRSKIRLFSIALFYIAAAASDLYGAVFSHGLNNSPIVMVGFVIASGGFLLTTLLFLRTKKPSQ